MLPKKYQNVRRSLSVKKSAAGLGLFTNEAIKREGFIIEYTGTVLTLEEADEKGGKYLFTVSKNKIIDGADRKNIARYINHSCAPNCRAEVRAGRVLVFAKRRIQEGEELSYHYGKEYFDEFIKPLGCRCPKCKKTAE
jgi:uncharacterized protein